MPPRERPASVPEARIVDAAVPEPSRVEPVTPEPVTPEPGDPEPGEPEPADPEPALEAATTEPVVPEPVVTGQPADAAVAGPATATGPEEAAGQNGPGEHHRTEPAPRPPTPGADAAGSPLRAADDPERPTSSTPPGHSTPGHRRETGTVESGAPEPRPSDQDLTSGALVRRSRRSPAAGWRRSVHRLTGGILAPGESTDEAYRRELRDRVRQPISGDYRIAVLSLKGGVGKTTTTVGLGSTFASLRGDCVIAVDANPDFGTLAQRVPQQTESTVRDLLAAAPRISRYADVRAHTSQAPSRLEVLASERDPAVSEAFSEEDYRRVVDILRVYYNVVLTDCGTGIMHSAMRGVLDLAHALVLVASPAIDGARSAAATLDWLQHHGFGALVERTVVVISAARPGATNIDMQALTGHFLARCRAVQVVPFDEHLAEGAEIDLALLRPATRRAFLELAAMVADDFAAVSGRHAAGRGPEPSRGRA
ncbi:MULTISPECIES: MinD/ParA family ATP-binding protein [Rhodococcus]|nr:MULTISPECIES: AAA family ATPase [Rhodococcus]